MVMPYLAPLLIAMLVALVFSILPGWIRGGWAGVLAAWRPVVVRLLLTFAGLGAMTLLWQVGAANLVSVVLGLGSAAIAAYLLVFPPPVPTLKSRWMRGALLVALVIALGVTAEVVTTSPG
jgi:hypothetical protein